MLPFPEVESSPPSMPYPLDVPSGQKAFGSLRPCRKIGRVPPGKPYFPEKHCRPAHRARTIFAVDGWRLRRGKGKTTEKCGVPSPEVLAAIGKERLWRGFCPACKSRVKAAPVVQGEGRHDFLIGTVHRCPWAIVSEQPDLVGLGIHYHIRNFLGIGIPVFGTFALLR